MTHKEISVGEYKLKFEEGRKYVRGMHLIGPCEPQSATESMLHSDCTNHMYPLSGDEFTEVYKIMNSNRKNNTKNNTLGKISEKLKKEIYLSIGEEENTCWC
ncbi:hypothetical protein HYZ41_02495 [archaeon]|nr:hypothetical protein [archaeon]